MRAVLRMRHFQQKKFFNATHHIYSCNFTKTIFGHKVWLPKFFLLFSSLTTSSLTICDMLYNYGHDHNCSNRECGQQFSNCLSKRMDLENINEKFVWVNFFLFCCFCFSFQFKCKEKLFFGVFRNFAFNALKIESRLLK